MKALKAILIETIRDSKFKFCILTLFIVLAGIADIFSIGLLSVFVPFLLKKEDFNSLIEDYNLPEIFLVHLQNSTLNEIIFVCIVMFLIKNFFLFVASFYEINFIKNVRIKKQSILFKHYLNLDYQNFISKNFSYYQRSIFNEVNQISTTVTCMIILLREIFLVLTIIISFSLINLKSTIILILLIVLAGLIFFYVSNKYLKRLGQLSLEHRLQKFKIFNEYLAFFKDIKFFNLKKYFKINFVNEICGDENNRAKGDVLSRSSKFIFEILFISLVFSIIIVFENSNINITDYLGIIVFFILGTIRMLPSANQISFAISKAKLSEPSCLETLKQIRNFSPKNLIGQKKILFNKEIKFENVDFFYNSGKYILKNFNLLIKKNDMICIYGDSGVGKTTVLNLLCGLLQPNKGFVTSDNCKISVENNLYWQTKIISYMGQDTFILNSDVRENITLNFEDKLNEEDKKKLQHIFKKVNLHKRFDLDYIFTNNSNISGGEKQRIGFARVLYKDNPILLFDEPTNNLDENNENIVIEEIKKLKGTKTIIVVSHNKKFKDICDKVIII